MTFPTQPPFWMSVVGVCLMVILAFAFAAYTWKIDPPEPRCQRDAAKLGAKGVYVAHDCWATYENQRPVRLW